MRVTCPHCAGEFDVRRTDGIARRWNPDGPSIPGTPLHPTYNSWRAMKHRCDNPNDKFYASYGGRGITYDPRWKSFDAFLADLGKRPEGLTLDRIDRDGNYEVGNVRWSTASEQAKNRNWDPAAAVAGRQAKRKAHG